MGGGRVSDARKTARFRGWCHSDGKDYCPAHAPKRTAVPVRTGGLAELARHVEEVGDPLAPHPFSGVPTPEAD